MLNYLYFFFIILGSVSIYFIYKNSLESFNNYNTNTLNRILSTLNDKNKHFEYLKKNVKQSKQIQNNKLENYGLFNSLTNKLALINSIKIYDYLNNYNHKMNNLYKICFENNNPCNKNCLEINPNFCKNFNVGII